MNISSATRVISSAVLVSAFVLAPIGNVFAVTGFSLPRATVAEAAVTTNGVITGSVLAHNYQTKATTTLSGVTVELRLDDNDVVSAVTSTNASGTYTFTVPQSSYRACVTAPAGYTLDTKQPSCASVSWQSNGTASVADLVLTSLPVITLVDGTSTQVVLGGTFVDPGSYATKDGVTFAQGITPFGTVDTKTLGDYKLIYTAVHQASGILVATTRTVSVVNKSDYIVKPHAPGIFVEGVTVTPVGTTTVQSPTIGAVAPTEAQSAASCKLLNSYMSKNSVNQKVEVLKLQTFLFIYEGLMSVRATGVYDEATERGVRIFQDRHFPEVLSLWGADGNTGNVYMTTQKKINEIYCGHEFPLSFAQLKEIAAYRVAQLGQGGSAPLAAQTTDIAAVATTAPTGGLSAWWNRTKQNLLAVMPSFGKKEARNDLISASGSVAADTDKIDPVVKNKTGNIATAFYNFRNFLNMTALAAFFALLVGVFAFGVSIYLYRRTRVEEEVVTEVSAPVVDIPVVPKKVK